MATFPILPQPLAPARDVPEYLPARMVNEFVYCPRLFYLEHVRGEFRDSVDTIEGQHLHRVVDKEGDSLPAPADLGEDALKTRSITLTSERLRVIAKLDVVEVRNGEATPVDTKHGRPRESKTGIELWPSDKVQLVLQILLLRESGYRCEEGLVFYAATRQRVRVIATPELIAETERAVAAAWALTENPIIPPPLEDSPKCPGCSLAPICLPDEVNRIRRQPEPDPDQLLLYELEDAVPPRKGAGYEVRRLLAPREERKPLYLNTQGLRVGKSGGVLQVREKEALLQEVRIHEICQLNLMGNIQVTTQAIQTLCEAEIPVSYFSQGGWFYGTTNGLATKNVFLRQAQYKLAEEAWFCRRLAGSLIAGKIRNQRTQLLRNHEEPPAVVLSEMKDMADAADKGPALESLLGIEGYAARLYFGALQGLVKVDSQDAAALFQFDFQGRNRRPPRDPINALLSLAYSMLTKDMTIACTAVGFDPMLGFYHRPRHGRPALALDLMEPFRPLIADSAVMQAINTKMVQPQDFVSAAGAVALRPEGRKAFYRAYELRMDTLVTHPLFDYRVSYRRLLEIQARLLGKMLQGEIGAYPVFVTR